jgi:hypothetical protein
MKPSTARRFEIVRKGRHYQLPDSKEVVPSVTNILSAINKPALVAWAANTERALVVDAAGDLHEDLPATGTKMSRPAYITTLKQRIGKTKAHQKELAKAAEIGTQAHALIEWNLRKQLLQEVGPEPKVSDKALWAFMAWEDWKEKANLAPLSIEQTIWSQEHGYAGTMDLYCELDIEGKRVKAVLDWKTGRGIYCESHLQSTAYVHALIEMEHAAFPTFGGIVRLPKIETDPEFEVKIIHPNDQRDLMEVFLSVKRTWEWMQEEKSESYKKWKASSCAHGLKREDFCNECSLEKDKSA